MLINTSEISSLFPDSTTDDLTLKINQTQALLESHLVANRKLEIYPYSEVKNLNNSKKIPLSFLPVLANSDSTPITVAIRQTGDWQSVTDFTFDSDLSEVSLTDSDTLSSYSRYSGLGQIRSTRRLTRRETKIQVKVSYYSGFNLNNILPGDKISDAAKASFIALIQNLASDEHSGIKRFELKDFYAVDYLPHDERGTIISQGGTKNSTLDSLLVYFKQFRPRSFNV